MFLDHTYDCFMERLLGKPQEKAMRLLDVGCMEVQILKFTCEQFPCNSNHNILY